MENEQKLPRPTVEQLNEYDKLNAMLRDIHPQSATYDETIAKMNDIMSSYDWYNYEFTDPATGKKGIKNAAGQILVPADFEGFTTLGDHVVFNPSQLPAKKNGKYGIVAADGTGKVLVDFRFDFLVRHPYVGLYQACWDGVKDKFGFVLPSGKVFIPNVLTVSYEPWNDFMLLKADDKYGAFDINTYYFVLPEYDQIDCEPDESVVFHKNGVAGYVVEETGEFVPIDQFEEDGKHHDAYVYNTLINY